ncbi:MAG: glycosyltransferase family 4 protein [Candidatus Woesearchaeota archaeon]
MKIYLNHLDPKRFHSVYEELLKNQYVNYIYEKKLSNTEIKNKNFLKDVVFQTGKFFFNLLKLPTTNIIIRNDFDLIHSCQSIPISKKIFVIDFEHISALGGFNYNRVNNFLFKKFLKNALESKRCKRILPWTNAAALSLKNLIKSGIIEKKIEVVYPTIEPKINIKNLIKLRRKQKKNNEITFLFVAFNFYRKGGPEAVNAFIKLNKKIKNSKMFVICSYEKAFDDYKKQSKNIFFLGLKSKKELYEKYFLESDVFVYPTYNDSYGVVFLEAMSFGLPIITIEDFSSTELIINKKNGFVIKGYEKRWYDDKYQMKKESTDIKKIISWQTKQEKERIVNEIYEKMLLLCENKKIMEKISKNNIEEITKGRFSNEKRNKRLFEIYREYI